MSYISNAFERFATLFNITCFECLNIQNTAFLKFKHVYKTDVYNILNALLMFQTRC